MSQNPKIISNKIRCKNCGDVIESLTRNDFRMCSCESVFVDGGTDYLRRGGKLENMEDLTIMEDPTKPTNSIITQLEQALNQNLISKLQVRPLTNVTPTEVMPNHAQADVHIHLNPNSPTDHPRKLSDYFHKHKIKVLHVSQSHLIIRVPL